MFELAVTQNKFLLNYAQSLVAEVADENFADQPLPGVNHPAWILGHLAYTGDVAAHRMGAEKQLDSEWGRKFGPGSMMTGNRADYPSKAELLETLLSRFAEAQRLAPTVTPELMSGPNPNPRMREAMPTLGDIVNFLLTGHMAVHLGQLSAWRRMKGLPHMF